ncbi:hypothetical protein ACWDO5_34850, partial [Streptomyces sp. NPDC000880]
GAMGDESPGPAAAAAAGEQGGFGGDGGGGVEGREAAGALREAAVRAVRWRGSGVAFPGLAERTGSRAR